MLLLFWNLSHFGRKSLPCEWENNDTLKKKLVQSFQSDLGHDSWIFMITTHHITNSCPQSNQNPLEPVWHNEGRRPRPIPQLVPFHRHHSRVQTSVNFSFSKISSISACWSSSYISKGSLRPWWLRFAHPKVWGQHLKQNHNSLLGYERYKCIS